MSRRFHEMKPLLEESLATEMLNFYVLENYPSVLCRFRYK